MAAEVRPAPVRVAMTGDAGRFVSRASSAAPDRSIADAVSAAAGVCGSSSPFWQFTYAPVRRHPV